jgi:chromosome partitioning protein
MKTLAIANQKGGVGKTTITVHLAHLAQEMGLRVLIVDFDPQANTSGCFTDSGGVHLVGSDLFAAVAGDKRPENAGGLGLIRADRALHDVEALPLDVLHNPAKALNALAADYDLCLIDTPRWWRLILC